MLIWIVPDRRAGRIAQRKRNRLVSSFALVLIAAFLAASNAGSGTTSVVLGSFNTMAECQKAAAGAEIVKVQGNLSYALVCVPASAGG